MKKRFECNEKIRFEYHEKIRFEWYKCQNIKMLLQLISMFGFDNKNWTISVQSEKAAYISGVQLNIHIIHQKLLKIWIL